MIKENNFIKMRVTQVPYINIFGFNVGNKIILDCSTMLLYDGLNDARKGKHFITAEMFKGLGYDYCEDKFYKLNI